MRLGLTIVLSLVAAACGGSSNPASVDPSGPPVIELSDMESRPACPGAGETLTDDVVDLGCWEGDEFMILGVHECDDGRRLWGEDDLWAWVGKPIVQTAGDSAATPEYAAAYEECQS